MTDDRNSDREALRRELAELYGRLGRVRLLSRERIVLHTRIARVKKRLDALDREQT